MRIVTAVEPKPGRTWSEDIVGHEGEYYWLFDGATPPSMDRDSRLTLRFLASISGHMTRGAFVSPGASPQELLKSAIAGVTSDFPEVPHNAYFPHATAVVCRLRAASQRLDYTVLGDSYVVVETGAGRTVVTDARLSAVAVEKRNLLRKLRRQGAPESSGEYRTARDALIADERKAKNREGGFWVASREPTAVEHALSGSIELRGSGVVMAASDGFARLATHTNEFSDLFSLAKSTTMDAPATLLGRLRAIERAGRFTAHPSSAHDDAAFITISGSW